MAENTGISWAHHTVNFWWGCSKVSPACEHCYAERLDARFHAPDLVPLPMGGARVRQPHWGPHAPRLLRVEAATKEAMRYQRRAVKEGRRFRVFTNSMSDFFEDRRDLDRARLAALDVIRQTPDLDWMILTKRPEKIRELLKRAHQMVCQEHAGHLRQDRSEPLAKWLRDWLSPEIVPPPANVWLGTTAESQEWADKRVPELLKVPAAVRFLSCEPLLGPVDLGGEILADRCGGEYPFPGLPDKYRTKRIDWLDWIIAGGESGPHARPMHPDWARSLRDQCAEASVPFHFKQWGEWAPWVNEDHYTHCGEEKHAHAWLDRDGERSGDCWIVDDDGTWSNWTGEPPTEPELAPGEDYFAMAESVAVMGRHGTKAAGRLLDGVLHDSVPEVTHA